jgi:RHS repeat-associated protein
MGSRSATIKKTALPARLGNTYTYDADDNRVKKSNGATGTLYWYMTPGIVAESDLAGNLKSEYIFFNGKRLVRVDQPSNAYHYYLSDALNSTSMVVSASGIIENESDYYPWGGELQFVANDSNHYKFTGKERDAETQLDYFGARYYSNGLGRFITPDWSAKPVPVPYADFSNPQSLNLYGYVNNNPIGHIDKDGHFSDANKDKNLPKPDAQHDHTITVRQVSGQGANLAGHATVQIDGGKEVGYGPKQDMTAKQLAENKSVPGQVEPRAVGVKTKDQVTIHVTGDQAKAAQGTIDAVAKDPGNYQLVGNNCANFVEQVVNSAGGKAPNDLKPGALVNDLRQQQYKDNSVQTH